jgi:dTDP-glucose 4,6-dehydratase
MHNIIVTGGAGFIGSNFIRKIIKSNYNIINIDALTYASNVNYLEDIKKSKNYIFYRTDISDKKEIFKIIKKFRPKYIFNFAAETHVDNSIKNSNTFIKSNILGTYSLLESIVYNKKILKKDFKFIQISTDEVFGDVIKKKKTTEKDVYNPSSPYSATKASADHLVKAWSRTYNIPFNIIYSCNNFGPNQNREKFIPVIINSIINKKKIPLYGDGKQIRDWIYVDDNIRGILKVAFHGKKNEAYNIGANNLLSNKNLIKIICNLMISKFNFKKNIFNLITHVNDRLGHDLKYSQNSNKIRNIGWKTKHNLEQGLEKTISWFLRDRI